MKYKVGDRVRIKSLDWYNKNKNKNNHIYLMRDDFYGCYFIETMSPFCNKIMTISNIMSNYYYMLEDGGKHYWTDEMIEGLAEEKPDINKWTGLKVELELSKSIIGVSNVEDLQGERFMSGFVKAIIPPEGYQFVDDNGNIINTTKIILEKKPEVIPDLQLDSIRIQREYCTNHSRIWLEIYEDDPNTCILTHLLVDEDHRQKGYGTKALEQAEMIAKDLGCNVIQLMVETDSWMHDWYLKKGYKFLKYDTAYTWLCKKL